MKPPTLIDRLYRASFHKTTVSGWRSNSKMRHALESAYRFVLADERTAGFLAELANESFIKAAVGHPRHHYQKRLALRIADSLRVQARVPHEAVWIEYDLHAYQKRAREMRDAEPFQPDEVPETEGWLIQQHPTIDTACIMHVFNACEATQEDGHDTWTFPFAFAWCCDDTPLPWQPIFMDALHKPFHGFTTLSSVLVGLRGYERNNLNCVQSPLILDPEKNRQDIYQQLITEWTGTVRRTWALLATIDNLPIIKGEVRQSKGFFGGHRIRKFLSHHTITLYVPAKTDTRVIARKAIAIAHRKRHRVRGHWRDDWRNPPSKRCSPHLWITVDDEVDHIVCELCRGRQIFVHKHERGDATLGWVSHDYVVKHEQEKVTST